ncbi:hypothetical protein ACFVWG_05960 [Kribbella sp. NPDC058245]|uniref:hypothetical protein n=1 Tax=Kribbella sp. NPDC058245 TaxID=3346399 RepID=UPI0036E02B45
MQRLPAAYSAQSGRAAAVVREKLGHEYVGLAKGRTPWAAARLRLPRERLGSL